MSPSCSPFSSGKSIVERAGSQLLRCFCLSHGGEMLSLCRSIVQLNGNANAIK